MSDKNHKYLKEAPLVHVLAHFKFSDFDYEESEIMALHREFMNIGYPNKKETPQEFFSLELGSLNTTKKKVIIRYSFLAGSKQRIIDVMPGSLTFKTTDYFIASDFFSEFEKIVQAFEKAIPQVQHSSMASIGLRYTDFIVPDNDFALSDYITKELLPFSPKITALEKAGISETTVKTADNRIMRISTEEILFKPVRGFKILPENLLEPNPDLAMKINIKHMIDKLSDGKSYAILDIDHQHIFEGSEYSQTELFCNLSDLHTQSDNFFWENITEQAKESWKFSKI